MSKRIWVVAVAAVLLDACGSTSPTDPTKSAPSQPAATSGKTYTLTGAVTDLTGARGIANATVVVPTGVNAGHTTTTDADGHYSLANLAAGPTACRATAANYMAADMSVDIPSELHASFKLPGVVPPRSGTPQCDPTLWPHMHDVQRIKIVRSCQTVTGTIATVHASDDGDVDMQLTLDPQFASLLNATNNSNLNGNLQIEAICQEPILPDVPDAQRTCANFTGNVPLPAIGTRVEVTGTYVLDSDHGWMEIHPISVLTLAR